MSFVGIASFLLTALLIGGCEELHPFESLSYKTPVTRIYSDPPGAEILLDGVSQGETPLTIIWNYEDMGLHTIRAVPEHKGHCVQRAYVKGEGAFRPGPKAKYPGEIHFDMTDCDKEILLPGGGTTKAGSGEPVPEDQA